MFAYCRNNPICRTDVLGTEDEAAFDDNTKEDLFEEHEGNVSGTISTDYPTGQQVGGTSNATGTSSGGGSSANGYSVTTGPNGYYAVPNPNNEKTETHHVVEQCQANKSRFSQSDIQGNNNKVDLPYALHRKISGFYSSKPDELGGLRVRDHLAGQSFEQQYQFGWEVIEKFWGELYGPK
jgi:hypothetical protein